jgi:hypothetical protein
MDYSFLKGVVKGLKYGVVFLVAGLMAGLAPDVKELTIGGVLVLVLNFLKVKWGLRLP